MDRASKDPFALMEELENVLGIRSCPMNWPIGVDGDFQGVYQRNTGHVLLYSGGNHGMSMADELSVPLDSPEAEKTLEKHYRDRLRDEIELLDEAGDPFDKEAVLSGKLTPLFFGSAVTNFGVEPFLEAFLAITPPPLPREADIGLVEPTAPSAVEPANRPTTATSDMLNKTCSRLDNASGRLTRRICFARGPSVRDLVLDFMLSFSFFSPKPCPRTPGHNTYYKRCAHFCKMNLSKRKNRMHQRLAGAGSGTESGYRAARRLDFCLRLCYTTLHWFASNVRS